jgi:periplasmic protein TonB
MSRLPTFIVGSAALHGALVTLASASALWLGGQTNTVLSVTLDGATANPHSSPVDVSPTPPQHEMHATAHRDPMYENARGATAAQAPTPIMETGRAPATTADSGNGALERARAQIEARVRTDMARHFDYPWFARQRGWQGDVVLAFVVHPDGRLDTLRVERGSGFALLDQSALDSLRRVERIPEAADWLGGREIAMHVPVLYRITGDR